MPGQRIPHPTKHEKNHETKFWQNRKKDDTHSNEKFGKTTNFNQAET